jgi:hypothetical protein
MEAIQVLETPGFGEGEVFLIGGGRIMRGGYLAHYLLAGSIVYHTWSEDGIQLLAILTRGSLPFVTAL